MPKKIRSIVSWLMVFVLLLGGVPSQSAKAATKPKLSETKKTITIGEKATLKVQNKVAGSKYTWSSSNKKIATVTSKGEVTAVKKGNTTITCKVTAGKKQYNLSCAVTVTTEVVVTTQAGIDKALKNSKVTKITIKTDKEKKFTIPSGNYEKKTLVVNAPKSEITNRGVFKNITIQGSKKWTEHAVGNKIKVTTVNANIVVGKAGNVNNITLAKKDANISLKVTGKVKDILLSKVAKVKLTVNGEVETVTMDAAASLDMNGSTKQVNLKVSKKANGANVKTTVPIKAVIDANMELSLEAGAEGTSIDRSSKTVEIKINNQTSKSVEVTTGGENKVLVESGKEVVIGENDTVNNDDGNSENNSSDAGNSSGDNNSSSGDNSSGGNENQGGNEPPQDNDIVYDLSVPNGSFEEMTTANSWIAKEWNMTNTVWTTDSVAYEGSYSQNIDQWNCNTTLSQSLTVEPGIYTVSLFVWADGSLEGSSLVANGKSIALESAGATQIDETKTWDKIELTKVRVEKDNKLDLQIVIGAIDASVTGYLDYVTFEKTGALQEYPTDASDGVLVNGGFTTDYSGWTVSNPDAVQVDAWSPNGDDDTKLSVYSANPVDVEVHQTIKNLPAGKYTVQALVYTDGSQSSAVMYTDLYDGQNPVEQALPENSGAWVVVSKDVEVEDGYLKVGFHVTGPAGMWLAIDDVTVTYHDPYGKDVYILDNGFEEDNAAWTIAGNRVSNGHNGSSYALSHEGSAPLDSYQNITGIEDGYYTLTAWTQNNGGQDACYLYAADTGLSKAMTAIPRNNFPYDSPDVWKKVTVRGIHVTNGSITVGLYTEGGSSSVCRIDTLRLEKEDTPYELLIGGDITELTYVEDKGGKYYDYSGAERDPLEILAENGWNIVRIRVYNDPGKGRGSGGYYVPEGYQDVEDALRLAKRAKNTGMQIQLSFHYSDYWSNPGTQIIPHEWQALIEGKTESEAVQILNDEIYSFTKDVLGKMEQQGTMPEYVSLGNETRSGLLFPYGTTGKWDNLASFYNSGARAVREVAPNSKIIIHLDSGGDTTLYKTYFGNARQRNVDYDIIGTSFYPFWTNKSALQFADFTEAIVKEFGKPVMCMETGFNWTGKSGAGRGGQLSHNGPYGDADSSTPELQRDFMIELYNEMQGVENGMCIGSLYWDPIMLYAGGQVGWAIFESNDKEDVNVVDNTALFDFDGKALVGLSAFLYNTRGTTTGMLAGKVVDAANNPVCGAVVTLESTGIQVTTNRLGDYFFPAVNPGTYSITVEKDGLGNATLNDIVIAAGSATHPEVIQISGTQSLFSFSGMIKTTKNDGTEIAVPNVVVKISDANYSNVVQTNSSGEFILNYIPEGDYELKITCNGYVMQQSSITISDSTTNNDYEITENASSVSGYVYDGKGVAVAGAEVMIGGKNAISQSDGSFVIDGVGVGSGLTLVVSKDGYMEGYADNITVVFGVATTDIAVYLPEVIAGVINSGFENGLDGWTASSTSAYTQTGSGGGQNSETKLSAWADKAYEADVHQTLTIVDGGTYLLRCYVQNGGGQEDLYVYVKDSAGNIIGKSEFPINSDWIRLDTSFTVSASETITVGFYVKSDANTWCNLDNFSLGLARVEQ
ncbi:glycosyl hydrolase 53 family protein [Anaerosporobacter sp.]|uniref:glycosyl hydrolase 53 family protein n=1 Tax=Anaerosporobacter sp. TaxID=1872529 RepID=UPI00286F0C07|nr:glycosyl hydrolase 53 family protein [Anaerosporobacter sp.]